jgi:hypothetical protein
MARGLSPLTATAGRPPGLETGHLEEKDPSWAGSNW